jgi:hypothetical protein
MYCEISYPALAFHASVPAVIGTGKNYSGWFSHWVIHQDERAQRAVLLLIWQDEFAL